jgi:hypothetical protein
MLKSDLENGGDVELNVVGVGTIRRKRRLVRRQCCLRRNLIDFSNNVGKTRVMY